MRLFLVLLVMLAAAPTALAQSAPTSPLAPPTGDPVALLKEGSDALQRRDRIAAEAAFKRVVALAPDAPHGYLGLALLYKATGEFDRASEQLATAIRLAPTLVPPYVMKAEADISRGKLDEAETAALEAVRLEPTLPEAHYTLGRVRWAQRSHQEALAAFAEAVRLRPDYVDARRFLAEELGELDRRDDAVAEWRRAMALDPKRLDVRFDFGRYLVRIGRLAEARELWTGYTEKDDRTHPDLGTVLRRAEARQKADEAVRVRPSDPRAWTELGMATMDGDFWVKDDRFARARLHFLKALDLDPKFAPAHYGLGLAYIDLGDNTKLDAQLKTLEKLDPALARQLAEKIKAGPTVTGLPAAAPPPSA